MESNKKSDNERAFRIHLRIHHCHITLSNIYENLVDRDFDSVNKDAKLIISEIKLILKALEDDDF
jgi:hypothetical protein